MVEAVAPAGWLGSQWLKPLREALPVEITYDQIRLVVAFVWRARRSDQKAKGSATGSRGSGTRRSGRLQWLSCARDQNVKPQRNTFTA
jgi:hypothetical protein